MTEPLNVVKVLRNSPRSPSPIFITFCPSNGLGCTSLRATLTMMMAMMQPEQKNKEQFKLLQYSDDSKSSLSDLELTEIVVPRKRKVRR